MERLLHGSIGCAVCRDKLRERRPDVAGWQGQVFTLPGVNMLPVLAFGIAG